MLGPAGRSSTTRHIGRATTWIVLLAACGCRQDTSHTTQPTAATTAPARQARIAPPPTGIAIRVRLAADLDAIELAVEGPCELRDLSGALLVSELNRLEPQPLMRGGRTRGFQFLGQLWPYEAVEIVPAQDGTLQLKLPGMDSPGAYQGTLRCYLNRSGRIDVINELDMEDYLRGVVASEMPNWFKPEALAAQAIAARTYAMYLRNTAGDNRTWDVKADQGSQVYKGLSRQRTSPAAVDAVDVTRGLVCVWDSPTGPQIFCAYYSAVCGGCTQSADNIGRDLNVTPLSGNVPCDFCAGAKYYRWGPERLTRTLITANLRDHYASLADMGKVQVIDILDTTPDGRPTRIKVADARGRGGSLRAEDFRLAVDPSGRILKSTRFSMLIDGEDVVFYDGHGWGHGVGMCQWGADGLARLGKSAAEILAYYYPGSRLVLAYW